MKVKLSTFILSGLITVLSISGCASTRHPSRIQDGPLESRLANYRLKKGDDVFIRIFKEERILELWMRNALGRWVHFSDYPICNFSGPLGPKKRQGDLVAPEGFYEVTQSALNPNSRYYKSFNLGYPNVFDRYHERSGDHLMVHGACVSEGCYAMTNNQIDEIYKLVEAALNQRPKSVRVHAFPFRMHERRMSRAQGTPNYDFWLQLKQGYDAFEKKHEVPRVAVEYGRYVVYE